MPTRKVSDRERLTLWARNASDDEIAEAEEIIRVEKQARKSARPATNSAPRQRTRTTTARKDPATNAGPTDGPEQ